MRCPEFRSRPTGIALVVCAVAVAGCANFRVPRIDPTGERLFVDAPAGPPVYVDAPTAETPLAAVALAVCPRETIAPVGSEVVLVAGVLWSDNYLRTNQRVEWMLTPGGVGQFVDLGRRATFDWLFGGGARPRKIDNTFAISNTSPTNVCITRGTPIPSDDVQVLRGQAWITVTSPVEGTSHVTAFAPGVYGWDRRQQSAAIHWVDAQWSFPPPAINPVGSRHVFTTSVMRHTDQSPCTGWRVRYEIADGPAAGFAPDGAQTMEVETDELGQASVEIFQLQPVNGTNKIDIQVIRPATAGGAHGKRLVLGSGSTLKTWTSADLTVRHTGPAVASVGATLTYQIEVSNPGDLPAKDVVLASELPEGLGYIDSQPAGKQVGRRLRWQLGELGGGQTRRFQVNLRGQQAGSVTSCAEATTGSGLKAKDCVTTTVVVPTLEVNVSGADQATVGEELTFNITITNRGGVPATGLLIKDRFDAGFEHAEAVSPIERDLDDLNPGQTRRIAVALRAAKPGRVCQTVEVTGDGGIRASSQICVNVVEAAEPAPPVQPPIQPPVRPEDQPTGRPAVSVSQTGPRVLDVGQTAKFTIRVTNTGEGTLTNVKITAAYDRALKPTDASEGHQESDEGLVWTLDSLAPRGVDVFEVNCRAIEPSSRACGRVTVTTGQKVQARDETCLVIRQAATPGAAAPRLTMTVADLHDPVTVGKEFTYEIRVKNEGQGADRRVNLAVTVPKEMIVIPLGTRGPTAPDIRGKNITFSPIDEVAAGQTLTFRVRVKAKQPVGQPVQVRLRAQLTSQNLAQPMIVEEETGINPKQ